MSVQSPTERLPVEINAGKNSPTVEIVWDDGHHTVYSNSKLRELCPCATCREAGGDPAHETAAAKKPSEASKPRRSLPMFKIEKYQPANMHYVGRYALGVTWKDNHQSIYPWVLLSEECPCEQCAAWRKASPDRESF